MKEEMTQDAVQENGTLVEGRNAVLEAFRSGKTIDKLYVLDGCKDGPGADDCPRGEKTRYDH